MPAQSGENISLVYLARTFAQELNTSRYTCEHTQERNHLFAHIATTPALKLVSLRGLCNSHAGKKNIPVAHCEHKPAQKLVTFNKPWSDIWPSGEKHFKCSCAQSYNQEAKHNFNHNGKNHLYVSSAKCLTVHLTVCSTIRFYTQARTLCLRAYSNIQVTLKCKTYITATYQMSEHPRNYQGSNISI